MRVTVILFSIGYILRIIFTSLQMSHVIQVKELGEFWAVQLEVGMSFACDLPPLYYFIYQHIVNLPN